MARIVSQTHPLACPDASTQRASPWLVRAKSDEWLMSAGITDESRFVGPKATYLVPSTKYPPELQRDYVGGGVLMALFLDPEGRVADMLVICSTSDSFAAAAADVIRKSRFQPATYDGKTVNSVAFLPFTFSVSP